MFLPPIQKETMNSQIHSSQKDEELFEATFYFNDLSDNLHLGSPIHCWQGPNNSIGVPSDIISLE
jgi:hypothetical protein